MRIWLKYLLGIALGVAFAVLLPPSGDQSQAVLDFVISIVVRFGRYTIMPLLFFSIATACFKLRDTRTMLKTGVLTFSTIIFSSVLLVTIGLASALFIRLPRIPITIEKAGELPSLDLQSLISMVFPYSGFEALLQGSYLLPCFVLAGLAGAGAADDQTGSKQAMGFFDSMSKVCYIVMSLFTELLAVGMVAIACRWTVGFIALRKAETYLPLIMLLAGDLLLTAFVIYPLILRFLCHDPHPFRVLYASICPFLVALFSGDTNLTLPLNIRHGKESLGIKHQVNAVTYPLFSIFARGGAALVSSVCFIVILRSYSMLAIKVSTVLWIGIASLLLSFVLGEHASGGPFLAVSVMCMFYGGGFEAGYLLLKDAVPFICAFAAAFDALTAMFGSYIVAVKTDAVERVELRKFI